MKKNIIVSFILIILANLLASCVSISGLYQDPTFTYESIISDNIGVGGVTSTVILPPHAQQIAYANLLRNALIQKYSGLNVMPAGDAVRALGTLRYQAMMDFYRQNGVVPEDNLVQLKNHIHHMRYLAFARITEENVGHNRDSSEDIHHRSVNIQYITALHMRVELTVYDLTSRRIVWSGSIYESNSNSNNYAIPMPHHHYHPRDYHAEAMEDMTQIIMAAAITYHHEYPNAPSSGALLSTVFNDFMAKFPKRPG